MCELPRAAPRHQRVANGTATLAVRTVKQGNPSTHPIRGDELRALRKLQREQDPVSPFVFTSERGSPFTTAGFARMVERAGKAAKLGFKSHPHMLRYACGFALANKGHDTRALQACLNIQHTVRYSELASDRSRFFWRLRKLTQRRAQQPAKEDDKSKAERLETRQCIVFYSRPSPLPLLERPTLAPRRTKPIASKGHHRLDANQSSPSHLSY
jgi:hypothetical protein